MSDTKLSDVERLGQLWVAEIIGINEKHRAKLASSLARCKPDGQYAEQHRVALAVLDRMLAASRATDAPAQGEQTARNAALEEAISVCESRHANGNYKYTHRDECVEAIRAIKPSALAY